MDRCAKQINQTLLIFISSNFLIFIRLIPRLFSLDSFNHTDDGTGRTVKYGFRPDEIDTSQLNESDAKEFLEQVQNTSKYYQEDSSLRLIPQHQTIHLFVGKHLGIKKADSYFSKAKKRISSRRYRFRTYKK